MLALKDREAAARSRIAAGRPPPSWPQSRLIRPSPYRNKRQNGPDLGPPGSLNPRQGGPDLIECLTCRGRQTDDQPDRCGGLLPPPPPARLRHAPPRRACRPHRSSSEFGVHGVHTEFKGHYTYLTGLPRKADSRPRHPLRAPVKRETSNIPIRSER